METPTTCPPREPGSVGAGEVVLRPYGELDLATVERFEVELTEAESRDPRWITIDLRALEFMDSSGLHSLLAARGRALENDRVLVLVPGQRRVQRLFALTGTAALFTFVDAGISAPER